MDSIDVAFLRSLLAAYDDGSLTQHEVPTKLEQRVLLELVARLEDGDGELVWVGSRTRVGPTRAVRAVRIELEVSDEIDAARLLPPSKD